MCAQSLSHVPLFATPWALSHQALLSMEFFKQEYWSELPFPSPGDLLDPGNDCVSLVLLARAGNFFFFLSLVPPGKPICIRYIEVLILSTSECDLIWK